MITFKESEKYRLKKRVPSRVDEDTFRKELAQEFSYNQSYVDACLNHTNYQSSHPEYGEFFTDFEIFDTREYEMPIYLVKSDNFWDIESCTQVGTLRCIGGKPKYTSYGDGNRYGSLIKKTSRLDTIINKALSNYLDANGINHIDCNNARRPKYYLSFEKEGYTSMGENCFIYLKDPNIIFLNSYKYATTLDDVIQALSFLGHIDLSKMGKVVSYKPNEEFIERVYDILVNLDEDKNIIIPNLDNMYFDRTGSSMILAKIGEDFSPIGNITYKEDICQFVVTSLFSLNRSYILSTKEANRNFLEALANGLENDMPTDFIWLLRDKMS